MMDYLGLNESNSTGFDAVIGKFLSKSQAYRENLKLHRRKPPNNEIESNDRGTEDILIQNFPAGFSKKPDGCRPGSLRKRQSRQQVINLMNAFNLR